MIHATDQISVLVIAVDQLVVAISSFDMCMFARDARVVEDNAVVLCTADGICVAVFQAEFADMAAWLGNSKDRTHGMTNCKRANSNGKLVANLHEK